ncbi:MAG TPA: formyltransferase family protein [Xanthobacteraceae bacterium]|nr:formyltransferase family protein [Xanthobacteraceae bacterium]
MTVPKFRFVLFALTGLGNIVLKRLIESQLAPDLVVTRAERMPYPYEPIPFIGDAASESGVSCLVDVEGEQEVVRRGAELLLIATYHRRVGSGVSSRCGVAINLHPSMLPRNRGASPFFWSIRNGDRDSGVTAHLLSERLDAGDIYLQQSVPIAADETQSTLRHKLGVLAAEVAVKVVRAHSSRSLAFHPQSEENATSYPRLDDQNRQLDLTETGAAVLRHVNALRDWPLALLGERGVRQVLEIAPATAGASPATMLTMDGTVCRVRTADADLVLQLD